MNEKRVPNGSRRSDPGSLVVASHGHRHRNVASRPATTEDSQDDSGRQESCLVVGFKFLKI